MALVRKKNSQWFPSENKDILVGETIEIGDYRALVELGDVELVDDQGNILPLPGTVFVCGICYEKIDSHNEYIDHVMKQHSNETKQVKEKREEKVIEKTEEPQEESFGERMKKARAAAKAKREAEKGK